MTAGPDTLKVLKWDGIDVLFWLTVHDCMNLMDTIRLNVARALRNFSANSPEDAKYMVQDERAMDVLKALARSPKEEVLQHVIGTVYNLLTVEECKVTVIKHHVIKIIFELAACGFISVRHVCSSCLHMAPEAIPDMSDPAVLELVLCLLGTDVDVPYVHSHAAVAVVVFVCLGRWCDACALRGLLTHAICNFSPPPTRCIRTQTSTPT